MPVKFYKTGEAYDFFSNVTYSPLNIVLNGKRYQSKSTEAVFQGLRALVSDPKSAEELILDVSEPGAHLQRAGQKFPKQEYDAQYNALLSVKEEVMFELLLVKATQHIEICKALLNTGREEIIENTAIATYDDPFWGNGKNGLGRNALGKAWMRVRQVLQDELNAQGFIVRRAGLSDQLAAVLKHGHHIRGCQIENAIFLADEISKAANIRTASDLKKAAPGAGALPGAGASEEKKHREERHLLFKGPSVAPGFTAIERVLKAIGATSLGFVPDKNKPFKMVLKCAFSTPKKASEFAKNAGNAPCFDNFVFLGETRAFVVFKKHHIDIHGRTHPRPMWEALEWECKNSKASLRSS